MIEQTKIAAKLESLREYTNFLRSYQKHSIEEIRKNYTLRAAIERYFQLSIEAVIDICQLIISDLKLKRPGSYREVIDILGSEGIIPDEFAYYFAPIAGFRNVLVHEYADIDLNKSIGIFKMICMTLINSPNLFQTIYQLKNKYVVHL